MTLLICTQTVDREDPILGFFHGWITEFSKSFDEVYVICLREGTHQLPQHVKVLSLGKESGKGKMTYLLRFYYFFGTIFFGKRPTYVFFHMGAIYNILAAPFFIVRKFFNTTFYWWKAHGVINLFGRIALLFVDRIYTSTESGFPITTKKRHIVGQAIDLHTFNVQQRDTSKDRYDIVYAGRITGIKRMEDFIQTIDLLRSRITNVRATIVGPIIDVSYGERLRRMCVEKGLDTVVSFVGPKSQHELSSLYGRSQIFLNPSVTHSMDKTVLEAVLCGAIPVTGNRAFVDLLKPYELYIENGTPEAYAKRIIELYSKKLEDTSMDALRNVIIAQHSLNTFTTRIFNT